mgnify:CR=1 FL=1
MHPEKIKLNSIEEAIEDVPIMDKYKKYENQQIINSNFLHNSIGQYTDFLNK